MLRRAAAHESERHVEHDEAVGDGALEEAVAVGKATLGRQEGDDLSVFAVESAHLRDGLGDLLPVGANVLDRSRADEARDAAQALDASKPALHRLLHPAVPGLARGDGDQAGRARVFEAHASLGHGEHEAVDARVGDHEVTAAAEDVKRYAVLARECDGLGDAALVRRDHQLPRRAAHAQGGPRR